MRMNKKGQSTMEYAILISLVIAAIAGMQVYVKRGVQGRIKDGVENMVTKTVAGDFGIPVDKVAGDNYYRQFEPYYLDSAFATERAEKLTEKFGTDTTAGKATSVERKTEVVDGKTYTYQRSGKQTQKKW